MFEFLNLLKLNEMEGCTQNKYRLAIW